MKQKLIAIFISLFFLMTLMYCGGSDNPKVDKKTPPPKAPTIPESVTINPIAFNGISWEDLTAFWQKMVKFDGGEYDVGTDDPNYPDRNPKHKVKIENFVLMNTPVTNNMFKIFIEDANGYNTKDFWSEEGWKWKNDNNITCPIGWNDLNLKDEQSEDSLKPVINVSWYEANALCKALTNKAKAKDDNDYVRLPTEFEWEVAANDGEGKAYPWGNDFKLEKLGDNEKGVDLPGSHLGTETQKRLIDMIGNLHQWTNSEYKLYPGNKTGFKSPKLDRGFMVARGTSFQYADHARTVHYRLPIPKDTRDPRVGIRLVHGNYDVLKSMWQQEEDKDIN